MVWQTELTRQNESRIICHAGQLYLRLLNCFKSGLCGSGLCQSLDLVLCWYVKNNGQQCPRHGQP